MRILEGFEIFMQKVESFQCFKKKIGNLFFKNGKSTSLILKIKLINLIISTCR